MLYIRYRKRLISKQNKSKGMETINQQLNVPAMTNEQVTEKTQQNLLILLNKHLDAVINNKPEYWIVLRIFILAIKNLHLLKIYVECLPENLLLDTTAALFTYAEIFKTINSSNFSEKGMTPKDYLSYTVKCEKANFIMDDYLFPEISRRNNFDEKNAFKKLNESMEKLNHDNMDTTTFTI